MKFKIINPSDEAYIKGEFSVCCLATLLFGEGKYALQQVDGELEMPIFLFTDPDAWLLEKFGKNLQSLLNETPTGKLADALLSVKLACKRTSLNDFTRYANKLGKQFRSKAANQAYPSVG